MPEPIGWILLGIVIASFSLMVIGLIGGDPKKRKLRAKRVMRKRVPGYRLKTRKVKEGGRKLELYKRLQRGEIPDDWLN